jgi:nucleoid-associated protein Lsr2
VAKKLKVIIVDDIDGTEGDGIVTHRFSLGSDFYEIDLCPQNLLSLRAALEPFVSAGRRVRIGNRRKPEPAPRPQNNSALDFSRQQRLAIRKWARDNGYDVADRRAFSQEVLAAYREASGEAEAAR